MEVFPGIRAATSGRPLREPKLSDLLSTESARGSYVFEVEDGLIPRWFTVVQRTSTWRGCDTRRRVGLTSPRIRLPLSPLLDR